VRKLIKATTLLLAALLTLSGAAGATVEEPRSAAAVVGIDTSNKLTVERKYKTVFEPALDVPMGWTGSLNPTCDPGEISAAAQTATFDVINFFRGMARVDPVVEDETRSDDAQAAALIMDANNFINHSPPAESTCYSAQGGAAAGSSNMAGVAGARAIVLYMESVPPHAGHRRYILDPLTGAMGHGATDSYDALTVIGNPTNPAPEAPDWVPWPSAGYFPAPLEPNGLWSLSSSQGADFSIATVTVTNSFGGQLPVDVHPINNGYSSPAVVWQVSDLQEPTPTLDRRYTVTVDDIQLGGSPISHTYQVKLFAPLTQRAVVAKLTLRRHLRAVVELTSATLPACAKQSDVLVQRRVSGTWRNVRRIEAPHNATMAVTLPDKTGSYRARSLGAVVTTNRCLADISNTALHSHG
jgi:uncharacterized protein YkwD